MVAAVCVVSLRVLVLFGLLFAACAFGGWVVGWQFVFWFVWPIGCDCAFGGFYFSVVLCGICFGGCAFSEWCFAC